MEEASEKVICELKRIIKDPLYWLVIVGGVSIRGVMAYMDMKHREELYFASCGNFWQIFGSFTEAILILLVLVHLFSYDREKETFSVINSTPRGRTRLFAGRICAGVCAVVISIVLLCVLNIVLSQIIGGGLPQTEWIGDFILRSVIAAVGSAGFFFVSSCVCDLTKNHPLTMGACACPFLISYIVNVSVIKPFGWSWFMRYAFFSELMRGRLITSLPLFWAAWYTLMIISIFALTYKTRKKRLEL